MQMSIKSWMEIVLFIFFEISHWDVDHLQRLRFVPVVRFLLFSMYCIAKPIARILDKVVWGGYAGPVHMGRVRNLRERCFTDQS